VWEDNNRNELATGSEKKPVIKPVLIDREIPTLQARLDVLNKAAGLSSTNSAAPVGGRMQRFSRARNGAAPDRADG